ncbi:MAG TPA: 1-(5-phosphoribosyl)-5-[(5-phosphoribosylamino)methylideneamino]imidazole-4-carboxamide isomerase [Blastocatellia bacterium]|nr:1-(5-phosphoribosyl)-5-[(5-phosphoribosylamino)methylideneamino]imidazole-4-carboxamide isomerase [Blastocatellia bacterium]
MLVIPAIDLKDGRCVRLTEGREDSARVYDRDPVEVAREYESAGARLIHVVDLDGAFLGAASENQKIIRRIADEVNIPLEVGGGVRSVDDIRNLLESIGTRYVIIGTLAIENPRALEQSISQFGDSVIVGIDARGRQVATRGWTETTQVDALAFAGQVVSLGVRRIIYTDIARDGRLAGPNFEMTREVALASGARVTASGGVSSLEDIQKLCALEVDGVDSVIVGKALYEKRFTLKEALEAASSANRDF